jgi:pSer/pThr/pTyr-binding forkhead associated (FHA) protein
MAKLILSMDGLVLKEIQLDKERISIGRKQHNDIQIDNLAISGEHAAVVTILNDSFLEDMNSTNGTLVNGQQVKKHFLRNQDVIELGKYKLKYVNEAPAAGSPPDDFDKPAGTPPSFAKAPEFKRNASDLSSSPNKPDTPAPELAAAIQLLSGGNAGKELDLTKTLTTLGKPGVQVAVITKRPNGFFITHVEGNQFPMVNGQLLDAQAHQLKDHDVIEIAGIKMEFFFKT